MKNIFKSYWPSCLNVPPIRRLIQYKQLFQVINLQTQVFAKSGKFRRNKQVLEYTGSGELKRTQFRFPRETTWNRLKHRNQCKIVIFQWTYRGKLTFPDKVFEVCDTLCQVNVMVNNVLQISMFKRTDQTYGNSRHQR